MNAPADDRLPEVFPPTLREVMLRPRWVAMLLLSLVVAGVFAWLGQWQLERALDTVPNDPGVTEQVRPLTDVVKPGHYLTAALVGQRVEVTGTYVPGDFLIVTERMNDGRQGYWVTGQLRVADQDSPVSVAVALGWAPTRQEAQAAAARLEASTTEPVEVTGRLISDEGPKVPPLDEPETLTRMSPAALLSRWHDIDGLDVYRQFITAEQPRASLTAISSHPPKDQSGLNWLNAFYAAEWAVFAGFAFYLWYRLARDAWEKEIEAMEDASGEAADTSG